MTVKGDGGASKWKPPGGKRREVDQEGDGGASKWKPPGGSKSRSEGDGGSSKWKPPGSGGR